MVMQMSPKLLGLMRKISMNSFYYTVSVPDSVLAFLPPVLLKYRARMSGSLQLGHLLGFLIIMIIFIFFNAPRVHAQVAEQRYEAEIISLNQNKVEVMIVNGDRKDQKYPVALFDTRQIEAQNLRLGDQVIVVLTQSQSGIQSALIQDHVRRTPLFLLFILFLIVVIVVGRLKGALSFVAMVATFFIIVRMVIPQIMIGNDPILVALLAGLFIIPATFYISHGLKTQTTIAVIGTFVGLIVTAFLAYIFVIYAKLTGFAAEEAVYIQAFGENINIRSLLLAGIIIGSMGILDDITISQTSIVAKLKKANPNYNRRKLYQEAMDVGRDHIASLVNTLILVYTGAALPLFVLFNTSRFSYSEVISMEIVATEIVRTLVGSIGIVTAVPITTFIAVLYLKRK